MPWKALPMKTRRMTGFSRLNARLNGSRRRCSIQRVNCARVSSMNSATVVRSLGDRAAGVMQENFVETGPAVADRLNGDAGARRGLDNLRQRRLVAFDVDLQARSFAARLANDGQTGQSALENGGRIGLVMVRPRD